MNDQSIAWMIRGGIRTESRDATLQSMHRRALAGAAAATSPDAAGRRSLAVRAAIASLFGRTSPSAATPSLDCCAA